jgi:hypothetical protein
MPPDATLGTLPVGQHAKGLPETSLVHAKSLGWIGAGSLVFLGLTIGVLGAIYSREVPIKTMPIPQLFPQPRVQVDQRAELRQLLEKQRRSLESYRWANDQHTLIQIPIKRAMSLIAKKDAEAYDPVAVIPGGLSSPAAAAARATMPKASGSPLP